MGVLYDRALSTFSLSWYFNLPINNKERKPRGIVRNGKARRWKRNLREGEKGCSGCKGDVEALKRVLTWTCKRWEKGERRENLGEAGRKSLNDPRDLWKMPEERLQSRSKTGIVWLGTRASKKKIEWKKRRGKEIKQKIRILWRKARNKKIGVKT